MIIKFDTVYERDIDLYVINNFSNYSDLLSLFLGKIEKDGYTTYSAESSLADENGESDITIVIEKDNHKIGLLIEDKIDAIAMPNQSGRYILRGDKGIREGKYDEYYIFIIAPKDYIEINSEAKKYPYHVSYEEILSVIKDEYGKSLFKTALEKKKKGYEPIEDKNTTEFWHKYYDYVEKYYPKVDMFKVEGPRGSKGGWPHIKTGDKRAYIMHKSDRGYLDLTFNGLGEYNNKFHNYMDKLLWDGMSIHNTGKSMAVRMKVSIMDFHEKFDKYINDMKDVMDKTMVLLKFFYELDVDDLYSSIIGK